MMKYFVVLMFLLAFTPVYAISVQDPSEQIYKEYLGVEVVVQGHPVYVKPYYTEYLSRATGSDVKPPTIAVLGTPVDVIMSAKVPDNLMFMVQMSSDGSKKRFYGVEKSRSSGFVYLEYHLQELGEWNFILQSPFDMDFYSFFLSGVQYTDNLDWGTSGGGGSSPSGGINIRWALQDYGDGDQLTFTGPDSGVVSFIYMGQKYGANEAMYFNKKNKQLIVVKGELQQSMLIPSKPGTWDRVKKVNKFQLFLAVVGFIVLVGVFRKSRRSYS